MRCEAEVRSREYRYRVATNLADLRQGLRGQAFELVPPDRERLRITLFLFVPVCTGRNRRSWSVLEGGSRARCMRRGVANRELSCEEAGKTGADFMTFRYRS